MMAYVVVRITVKVSAVSSVIGAMILARMSIFVRTLVRRRSRLMPAASTPAVLPATLCGKSSRRESQGKKYR
jgi:hypothetical protein